MTRSQKDKLREMVNRILKRWKLSYKLTKLYEVPGLGVTKSNPAGEWANMKLTGQKSFWIRINPRILELEPIQQAGIMAHEVMHIATTQLELATEFEHKAGIKRWEEFICNTVEKEFIGNIVMDLSKSEPTI